MRSIKCIVRQSLRLPNEGLRQSRAKLVPSDARHAGAQKTKRKAHGHAEFIAMYAKTGSKKSIPTVKKTDSRRSQPPKTTRRKAKPDRNDSKSPSRHDEQVCEKLRSISRENSELASRVFRRKASSKRASEATTRAQDRLADSRFDNDHGDKAKNQNYWIVQQMRRLKKESGKPKPRRQRAVNRPVKSSKHLLRSKATLRKSQRTITHDREDAKRLGATRQSILKEPRGLGQVVGAVSHFYTHKLNVSIDNSRSYVNNSIGRLPESRVDADAVEFRTMPGVSKGNATEEHFKRRITFSTKQPIFDASRLIKQSEDSPE